MGPIDRFLSKVLFDRKWGFQPNEFFIKTFCFLCKISSVVKIFQPKYFGFHKKLKNLNTAIDNKWFFVLFSPSLNIYMGKNFGLALNGKRSFPLPGKNLDTSKKNFMEQATEKKTGL